MVQVADSDMGLHSFHDAHSPIIGVLIATIGGQRILRYLHICLSLSNLGVVEGNLPFWDRTIFILASIFLGLYFDNAAGGNPFRHHHHQRP